MASRLRVILGTGDFARPGGNLAQEQSSHEILQAFLARGYTDIDTALMYGAGVAEKYIGQYIVKYGKTNMVLATKCNPWESKTLKYDSVIQQASQCLSSLQSSCVDIFYLHAPDHNNPLEETLRACNQLHQEGKFKELGLSNYASWEVMDAYHICQRNGWVVPTVYQSMYNAITRNVELELFPCLRHLGIRFYAYNPTACGLLTGKYRYSDLHSQPEEVTKQRFFIDSTWSSVYRDRYWRESAFQGVGIVQRALEESYGVGQVSLVSAAFRWLNHHSLMKPECGDGIIVGVSRLEQLTQNLDACEEGPLDPRVVKAFDQAWRLDKPFSAPYCR